MTAGSRRCLAPRCLSACMPCAGWQPQAGTTGHCTCRPFTTSRRSPATWTLPTCPGAGIPSTPGRCAWPTPTSCSDTIIGSATSARPACRGGRFSTSASIGSCPSFLEDAAADALPPVSWIDPAFTNFNLLGFPVNDDPPPADIKDGQDLVLAAYDALAASPQWDRSLLVIVYDEHGGFYDHVPRRRPPTMTPEPSAATACGCPRSSSRHGSNRAPYRTPCSTTPRSSRRSCCGSAPRLCPSGSRAERSGPDWAWARSTRASGWPTPAISGNS